MVNEITMTDGGFYVVATWEWRNGFNLIGTRRATFAEIMQYAHDGVVKVRS